MAILVTDDLFDRLRDSEETLLALLKVLHVRLDKEAIYVSNGKMAHKINFTGHYEQKRIIMKYMRKGDKT